MWWHLPRASPCVTAVTAGSLLASHPRVWPADTPARGPFWVSQAGWAPSAARRNCGWHSSVTPWVAGSGVRVAPVPDPVRLLIVRGTATWLWYSPPGMYVSAKKLDWFKTHSAGSIWGAQTSNHRLFSSRIPAFNTGCGGVCIGSCIELQDSPLAEIIPTLDTIHGMCDLYPLTALTLLRVLVEALHFGVSW